MTVPFVTLGEVKQYLQINSNTQDNALSNAISFSCSFIEEWIGREVLSNTYTELHHGGTNSVFTKRIPINNVNTVAEYNGFEYISLNLPEVDGSLPNNLASNIGQAQVTWDSATGRIVKHEGMPVAVLDLDITGQSRFRNFFNGIRIIYNGGYDNPPPDLKMAALEFVKLIHKGLEGGGSMSFQGEQRQPVPLTGNIPPHIRRILDLYRLLD